MPIASVRPSPAASFVRGGAPRSRPPRAPAILGAVVLLASLAWPASVAISASGSGAAPVGSPAPVDVSPAPRPTASASAPGASSPPSGSPSPGPSVPPSLSAPVTPPPSAPPSVPPSPAPSPSPLASFDAARVAAARLPPGVQRPDIVVVLIDDLPAMDDRLWLRLPTIKRLFLDSGVRFTDYIGNDPLCCPGRANLLTGQWTIHHGVSHNDGRLFDPRETIATELNRAGYWTGIFGKYFNNTLRLDDPSPVGWDRSFIYSGGYWDYPAYLDGRKLHFGRAPWAYSTTVISRIATNAVRTAPREGPRFVWLAPYATHGGFDRQGRPSALPVPADSDAGDPACRGVPRWSTAANREVDLRDKPAFLQAGRPIEHLPMVNHCEALLAVDRMLASVLARFTEQGRPEPMIVLTADNGMAWGAHRWRVKMVPYATPIPLFIHWNALLGETPATVTTTITNVDIAPTLCAIAGCTMGPFPDGDPVDGISFLSLLNDVAAVNGGAPGARAGVLPGVARRPDGTITGLRLGREVIYEEHDSRLDDPRVPLWHGLRTTDESPLGRWVYSAYATGERELYDLSGGPCWEWSPGDPGDPCQLTNRIKDPSVADLRIRLANLLSATHPVDWSRSDLADAQRRGR